MTIAPAGGSILRNTSKEALVSSPEPSLNALIDQTAGATHTPGGVAAAAVTAAFGLALFEKALAHPAEGKDWQAGHERQTLTSLRQRALTLATKDAAGTDALARASALPAGPDRAQATAGARLMIYRSARRLVDLSVQGLTLLQHPLDFGDTAFLTDIEIGHRLLAAALEGGLAASEDQLRELDESFTAVERPPLEAQARQGRELAARAAGELSWRRGKV